MRTSEQTNELSKALATSQGKFPKIGKSHTAEVAMKNGGKYSYSYADLADVLEGIRPVLAAQEIAIVQAPDIEEDTGKLILRTRLAHASGQWVESIYPLPNGGSAQEMGSALTYARRYSLTALAGITAEDDDDGQRAAPTPKREPKPVASRPAAPAPEHVEDETQAGFELQDRAEMIRLRKLIRTNNPTHPAVVDGSIGSMSLAELQEMAQ